MKNREYNEIDEAIEFLKSKGYHVDNLWHIDDILAHFDVPEEAAEELLNHVIENSIVSINEDIQYWGNDWNYKLK